MDFLTLANERYSCRSYDKDRPVEEEKLEKILAAARLSPSACNGQPYLITVCRGDAAAAVAEAVSGPMMNKFAKDAPILLVISERPYVASAALGAKIKKNDYRSIDIGILSAFIVVAAHEVSLDSCILGWLDDMKIRKICSLDAPVRLVITLGYGNNAGIPEKKRKPLSELVKTVE